MSRSSLLTKYSWHVEPWWWDHVHHYDFKDNGGVSMAHGGCQRMYNMCEGKWSVQVSKSDHTGEFGTVYFSKETNDEKKVQPTVSSSRYKITYPSTKRLLDVEGTMYLCGAILTFLDGELQYESSYTPYTDNSGEKTVFLGIAKGVQYKKLQKAFDKVSNDFKPHIYSQKFYTNGGGKILDKQDRERNTLLWSVCPHLYNTKLTKTFSLDDRLM